MTEIQKPKPRRWRRKIFLLVLLYMVLRWFEYRQVYQPTRHWDTTPPVYGLQFEDLSLPVGKGDRASAWYLPAPQTNAARVILVCHGNGGNICHRLDLARLLVDSGWNVLLLDFRGYGKSSGRPGEEKTYEDAQAAWRWLRERGFAATNIIAYGESLGGGVAAELALRERVGGLVIQSSFTSIPDLGARLFPFLPVRLLATIKYNTLKKLPLIHTPLLVMHSREDTLIPFSQGRQNFEAANEPKLFVELKGDHNEAVSNGRAPLLEGMRRFMKSL